MNAHEQYELLVGEIGIDRLQYLYSLDYWEIILISRGYQHRCRMSWEQSRLIAYNARFCMGAKNPPTLSEWLPFPWNETEDDDEKLTDDEINDLRQRIIEENRRGG